MIAGVIRAFLFPVHVNNKATTYMDSSKNRRTILIDGEKQDLVFHPKKEAGDRINLSIVDPKTKKATNYYIDNTLLANEARKAANGKLSFVTMKDRLPKDADKAKEAFEARKLEVTGKPKVAPKAPKQEAPKAQPEPAKEAPQTQVAAG